MQKGGLIVAVALAMVLLSGIALAAAPQVISVQGRLINRTTSTPESGIFNITFNIYDDPVAGTLLYTESHNDTKAVNVTRGVFNVHLGTINTLTLPFNIPYYLELEVNGETVSPRLNLTSAAYGLAAASLLPTSVPVQVTTSSSPAINGTNTGSGIGIFGSGGIAGWFNGPVNITGLLRVSSLEVYNGPITFLTDLVIGNPAMITLYSATGNGSFGGLLNVLGTSGTSTFNNKVNITHSTGSIAAAGNITAGNIILDVTNTRVGIGTLNPIKALDVVGDVGISNNLQVSNGISANSIDLAGGAANGGVSIGPSGSVFNNTVYIIKNITDINVYTLDINGSLIPPISDFFTIGDPTHVWNAIYAGSTGIASSGPINGSALNVGTLTGMIKGTTGTLSAVTGTSNYAAYWSDANTIAAEQYLVLSRGGTAADLSGAGNLPIKKSGAALTAAAINIGTGSSDITGTLPVGSGGTGATSFTSNALIIGGASLSSLALGTLNQILGVNAAGNANEYKTVSGAANEIDITNGANSITIGIIDPLAATKGGTGISTYTAGDVIYSNAPNALGKLAIGAANRVLTSTGSAPQWSNSINLTEANSWLNVSNLNVTNLAIVTGLTFNGNLNMNNADVYNVQNVNATNGYFTNLNVSGYAQLAGVDFNVDSMQAANWANTSNLNVSNNAYIQNLYAQNLNTSGSINATVINVTNDVWIGGKLTTVGAIDPTNITLTPLAGTRAIVVKSPGGQETLNVTPGGDIISAGTISANLLQSPNGNFIDANVTNWLNVSKLNVSDLAIITGLTFNGNLNMGNSDIFNAKNINATRGYFTGVINTTNGINASGLNVYNLATVGNFISNNWVNTTNLNVSNNAWIGNDLSANAGSFITTLNAGGGNFTIASNGDVGIGTVVPTPAYKLYVNGSARVGETISDWLNVTNLNVSNLAIITGLKFTGNLDMGGSDINNTRWMNTTYLNVSDYGYIQDLRVYNNITIGIGSSFINGTHVGIGTAVPNQPLEVIGSINTTGAIITPMNLSVGNGANAPGSYGTALGYFSYASGEYSAALGSNTETGGNYSMAVGDSAIADGNYSTAIGYSAYAKNPYTTALGPSSYAEGFYSTAIGPEAITEGDNATAIGRYVDASATNSFVIGTGASGSSILNNGIPNSFMIGYLSVPKFFLGLDTGSVGINTTSPAAMLHVSEGAVLFNGTFGGTPASGGGVRMMWIPAKAAFRAGEIEDQQWNDGSIGYASFAAGFDTNASGSSSTALGESTGAYGTVSTALGSSTGAIGVVSTAMGFNTFAIGDRSTSMGSYTNARGYASTSMGFSTEANGDYSTATGYSSNASGRSSISMGESTNASGDYSTAMGYQTIANNSAATAMGANSLASGDASLAVNGKALGTASVAIGQNIIASNSHSFVIGEGVAEGPPLVNNIADSLVVGFRGNLPTLYIGPASGAGTFGKVGIGTNVTAGNYVLNVSGSERVTDWVNATKLNVSNNAYIGGNVGIGTMNPGRKLTVSGTINITGATEAGWTVNNWEKRIEIPNNGIIQWYKGTGTISRAMGQFSDDTFYIGHSSADDSSGSLTTDMVINGNGNVAIGTSNPGNYKLNVIGDINASWVNASWMKATNYYGTSGVFSGWLNVSKLNVSDLAIVTGLKFTGDLDMGGRDINNTRWMNTTNLNATNVYTTNLIYNQGAWLNTTYLNVSNKGYMQNLQVYDNITIGTGTSFINGTHMGIGTTNPNATLEIQGSGTNGLSLNVTSDLYVNDTSGNVVIGAMPDAPAKLTIYGATGGNALAFGNSVIQMYTYFGSAYSSANAYIGHAVKSVTPTGYVRSTNWSMPSSLIDVGGDITFATLPSNTDPEGTAWSTSNNTKLIIKNGGNVGIGTANPAEKLDVEGNIMFGDKIYANNSWSPTSTNLVPDPYFTNLTTNTTIVDDPIWGHWIQFYSPAANVTFGNAQRLPSGEYARVVNFTTGAYSGSDLVRLSTDLIPVDNNRTYKFSVWAKTSNTGITAYLGLECHNSSRQGVACTNKTGNPEGNAYFAYELLPAANTWHKQTGYLFAASTPTPWVDPVENPAGTRNQNFKMGPDVSYVVLRLVSGYDAGNVTFALPAVEEVQPADRAWAVIDNANVVPMTSGDKTNIVIGYGTELNTSNYGNVPSGIIFNATAIGTGAFVTGNNSIAIGSNAVTSGSWSDIAIGTNAKASGAGAGTAVGFGTKAAYEGTAIGYLATAEGPGESTAVGWGANASNWGTGAFGVAAIANGYRATAVGIHSQAYGAQSIAIGEYANATTNNAIAIGPGALVSAGNGLDPGLSSGVAIGDSAQAAWEGVAIGPGGTLAANQSTAVGYSTTATGDWASAFGFYSSAAGDNSTAIGALVDANTYGAIAIGVGTVARHFSNNIPNSFMVGSATAALNKPMLFVNLANGRVGINTTNPTAALDISVGTDFAINVTTTGRYPVYATTSDSIGGSSAVVGLATASTGGTYGGQFSCSSSGGCQAVRGSAGASTGVNYGVYGEVGSGNGFGLYTPDNATVGSNLRVGGNLTVNGTYIFLDDPNFYIATDGMGSQLYTLGLTRTVGNAVGLVVNGTSAIGYIRRTAAANTVTCSGTNEAIMGGGCDCGANNILKSYPSSDDTWTCLCSAGTANSYALCARLAN